MNTAMILPCFLAALPLFGTLAGLIQRNTTGKPQRIAAAGAAIFWDTLKLADAVRGNTNANALMLNAGQVLLHPAASSQTAGFIGKPGEPLVAGQLVSLAGATLVGVNIDPPPAPDSSKLPGIAADAPTTKPDVTQS